MSKHINHPPDPKPIDFLLAYICHLHHARAHQLFEEVGLYRGQPPVLRELWEQEGLPQNELAERLNITPATLTRMLQRMEKSGFLQRVADANDQRISRVYLTESGRQVQARVETMFRQMEAETFAGLTEEELLALRGTFLRIIQNLEKVTSGDSDE